MDALPGIKKSFIGSGVRYDLLLHKSKDEKVNQAAREYTRELITKHVSGRLKVAPEHTSPEVLKFMRKPSFDLFYEFKRIFDKINKEEGLNQQIIPYFISSHPGCHEEDMAELAVITKGLDFHLEQVQDFTPTPMTISTETWYTGYDPYTLEPVFSAKTQKEKLAQRMFFFWYKPEERRAIESELRRIGRADLIDKLYDKKSFGARSSRERRPITMTRLLVLPMIIRALAEEPKASVEPAEMHQSQTPEEVVAEMLQTALRQRVTATWVAMTKRNTSTMENLSSQANLRMPTSAMQ